MILSDWLDAVRETGQIIHKDQLHASCEVVSFDGIHTYALSWGIISYSDGKFLRGIHPLFYADHVDNVEVWDLERDVIYGWFPVEHLSDLINNDNSHGRTPQPANPYSP